METGRQVGGAAGAGIQEGGRDMDIGPLVQPFPDQCALVDVLVCDQYHSSWINVPFRIIHVEIDISLLQKKNLIEIVHMEIGIPIVVIPVNLKL